MGVFNHATNRMIKKSDTLILSYLHKIVKFDVAKFFTNLKNSVYLLIHLFFLIMVFYKIFLSLHV